MADLLALSSRIIDEGITPLFREGDMNGGVTVGVYQIARVTNPEVDLRPYLEGQIRQRSPRAQRTRSPWHTLFGVLVLLAIFSTRMGLLPLLFMGGGLRRGMGGFSGGLGGGGGFSGGGGGFSGGGASGGW